MSNLKPWTTAEMMENASNWSLAGDVRLLGYLQTFSDNMLSQAEETNDNLNKLMGNLNNTRLSLDIAKKEFSSLHNTQFVESRVYEDDYSDSTTTQDHKVEDKNVEDSEAAAWKEAVLEGIKVVNTYFEKVEVPGSDSEDETDFPSYVLRPKDPYADRPLPSVIGSEEWHKKWHVGLLDTSSESEDDNVVEKFSESDSDDLNINDRIKFVEGNESISDTSRNVTSTHPVANSTFEDMDNNSSLYGLHDPEHNNNSVPIQAPVSTNTFAHELARKLGHVIEQNPKIMEPEVNRKPIQQYASNRTIGNLFDDEPPPLNDNDDLFGGSSRKGLFSGGSGLFDDVGNEDNRDRDLLKASEKIKVSKEKLPDLFSDDYDNLFSSLNKSIEVKSITKKPEEAQFKKVSSGDLFYDAASDDDDDLFKDTISKPYNKSYLPSGSNSVPFFTSEPPELNLPTATVKESKKTDKKPIGGVKLFGDTDILGQHNNLKPTTQHSKNALNVNETSTAKNIPIQRKSSGLFDDFHEGSINSQSSEKEKFEKISEPSTNIFDTNTLNIPVKSQKPETKSINLFDDTDDIFGDDLFSNISVKKFTSDLFSDDIVSDKLFVEDNKKSFHEDLGFTSPKKTMPVSNKPTSESTRIQESPQLSKKPKDNDAVSTPEVSKIVTFEESKSVFESTRSEIKKDDVLSARDVSKDNTKDTQSNNPIQHTGVSINVDLFDQNPPDLDDAWDSKSDNLFEDNENLFDSTSVVTGHRSGLFDDEPPSLFSESSGIVKDMSYTRVETDDSFNPYASSSRRLSTDIFNEQQSNDSFFVTKNRSNIEHRTQSTLDSIPETSSHGDVTSTIDVTPSRNIDSLFGDSTFDYDFQQSTNTDDLFSQDVSIIKPQSNTGNVKPAKAEFNDIFFDSKVNTSKSLKGDSNFDDSESFKTPVSKAESTTNSIFEDIDSDIFSLAQEKQEVSSKNLGKREELNRDGSENTKDHPKKPFESHPEPAHVDVSTDEFASKIGSPGKLKHNLNINISALKPGIGIITKKDMNLRNSIDSSSPLEKFSDDKEEIPEPIESSTAPGMESQILTNITKDRAKIVVKRRPSTRKARQEAVRNSIADFRISVPPAEGTEAVSDKEVEEKSAPNIESREVSQNKNLNTKTNKGALEQTRRKSFTSTSLFDDPDDFDELFSSVKSPPKTNITKTSLFDDENDEDIFGDSAGLKTKNVASNSRSQPKKLPKAAPVTKLQNTSVTDDPLSFFRE